MRGAGSKNAWALFLLILAGIVLGGFIGGLGRRGSSTYAGFLMDRLCG